MTFDQPMLDKGWSWAGGGDTYPQAHRCATLLRLRADQVQRCRSNCSRARSTWVGVNSPSHKNFQSEKKVPAARYVDPFRHTIRGRQAHDHPGGSPQTGQGNQRAAETDEQPAVRQQSDGLCSTPRPGPRWSTSRSPSRAGSNRRAGTTQLRRKRRTRWSRSGWPRPAGNDFKARTRAIAALGNISCKKATQRADQHRRRADEQPTSQVDGDPRIWAESATRRPCPLSSSSSNTVTRTCRSTPGWPWPRSPASTTEAPRRSGEPGGRAISEDAMCRAGRGKHELRPPP